MNRVATLCLREIICVDTRIETSLHIYTSCFSQVNFIIFFILSLVQFENFFRPFLFELDIMNHAFHGWVDTHQHHPANSDFVQYSVASTLGFPLRHGLGFIIYLCLVLFMPQPKLYSVQVKAELRFHKTTSSLFSKPMSKRPVPLITAHVNQGGRE